MSKVYEEEFKERIVRPHLEDGCTLKSITDEYGVSKSAISSWCQKFSEECQETPAGKEEYKL